MTSIPAAHRTPPHAIRERAFHAWLARTLPAGRSGGLPLGDDAAVLRPPPGSVAVVTTDSLVEGTHFLRNSPPLDIGRAATSVSLSDLAAKGATPAGLLVSLIVPAGTPQRWAEAVVRGSEAAAAKFGAHVIGGDTKAGGLRAVVSTAIGWGRERRLAPRSGARVGDVLVTTGSVGRGGLAYERSRRGPGDRRAALRALLDVRPRVREGVVLAPQVHAMLDTSDGLAEGCRLMAAASGVRTIVQDRALPIDPALARENLSERRRRSVAFFGGDYELLAAVPAERVDAAIRSVRTVGGRLTRIGEVARGHGAILVVRAKERPMPRAGWDPFVRRRAP
ncbi:MAG: thiamine-phosphate kinase [Thermoplasmata archaeon]